MKMKILQRERAVFAVLLALLLSAVGVTNATAQSFTVGNLNYSLNDDGASVTVTGHVDGQNATGELVIPESVELYGTSYPVTVIGEYAFQHHSGLTGSLVIPNSVITIGYEAFGSCYGFSNKLNIGNSVRNIGAYAFAWCNFTGSLTIPESVENIDYCAFRGCDDLTTLYFNAINCNLYGSDWGNAHWLEECSSMTMVYIGENVQAIPANFLRGRSSFTGELVIPESVTTIRNNAFNSCSGFTGSLNIPESVMVIESDAFNGCNGFTGSLSIPNTVTNIGANAFTGCTGFSGTLTLGSSLEQIGNTAFFGACQGFTEFNIWAETPPVLGNNVFISADYSIPVMVPCGSSGAYQNVLGWSVFTNIQDTDPCQWMILATVDRVGTGTVEGAGSYEQGQICTLIATPNDEFEFLSWTEDGNVVSTDAEYSFTVESSRNLVANFTTGSLSDDFEDGYVNPTYWNIINNEVSETGGIIKIGTGCNGDVSITSPKMRVPENGQFTMDRNFLLHREGNDQEYYANTTVYFNGNGDSYIRIQYVHDQTYVAIQLNDYYTDTHLCNTLFNNWSTEMMMIDFANGTLSYVRGNENVVMVEIPQLTDFQVDYYNVKFEYQGWYCNNGVYMDYVNINNEGNYMVFAAAQPSAGGTVSGAGIYDLGQTCTLTATPGEGFFFVNWTENGEEVSTDAEYSFVVEGNRNLVAHFVNPDFIVFADPDVEAICVERWDNNGDGFLSYEEAAAVTDLGWFDWNDNIDSFDELQYFTNVTYLHNDAFSDCHNLTSITFPENITTIEYYAFASCNALTNITMYAATPPELGYCVFCFDHNNTVVTVPCNATSRYQNAGGWSEFSNYQEPDECVYEIMVAGNQEEAGTVSGAGSYQRGEICTLTATANEGYVFVNWLEDGEFVSTDAEYTFTVYGNRTILARFRGPNHIVFADPNVETRCVELWDSDGDGFLSYEEAAAVTDLDYAFQDNDEITTFDELQYFTGLTYLNEWEFYHCDNLSSVVLPASLTSISYASFEECYGLVSIVIPENVTYIGGWAFSFCYALTNINVLAVTPPEISGDCPFCYTDMDNVTVTVPCGMTGVYQNAYIWNEFANYQESDECVYEITITLNHEEAGTVSGAGSYQRGEICTLTATAGEGCTFLNWEENGQVVSTEAEYAFEVTCNRDLIANFALPTYTITANANPTEGGTIEFNSNMYDFEDGTLQGWTAVDADGDGRNWFIRSNDEGNDNYHLYAHNGSYFVTSFSYYGGAIYPDNYLISPELSSAGSINYFVAGQSQYPDHYGVYASTTGNSIYDFSLVYEETIPAAKVEMTSWYERTVQLPQGTKYVAFRHYNSDDMYFILLDDITIMEGLSRDRAEAIFEQGSTCSLVAIPNYGYEFESWTEDGSVVSTEAEYSFTVTEDRDLVANFATLPTCNLVFDFYDSYGDGWNGNRLVVSNDFGFYEELTLDNGSSGSYTISMIDGSHVTLGWINGSWIGECSYVVHFENGCLIYEGSQSLGFTYEFDFNCDDAFTPVAITAVPNFDDRGRVTGAGEFVCGEVCTLTATPNEGHRFSRWMENGEVVSAETTYSFTVTRPRNLVAVFSAPIADIIDFVDPNVEAICVSNWDSDGDGFLSYTEAEDVSNLGNMFQNHGEITSFDELQYFTGLTYLNSYEFYYCYYLNSIVIPENVTDIYYAAFAECQNLNSIVLPTDLSYIDESVFNSCYELASINFPSSLESIGNYAFAQCYNLTGLELPNSLEYIGYGAFANCSGLTGTLEIPSSVTSIEGETFYNCSGLTGLVLHEDIYYIGNSAFRNCSGLRGEITLPESLESVGVYAFAGCDGIRTVNYNATECYEVGSTDEPVFSDCAITHIRIGENVESIPNYAFKRCFTVTEISSGAVVPPTIYASTFGMVSRSIPVHVPVGSGEAYRTAQYWEEFFNITEDYSSSQYTCHWTANPNQFESNMTVIGVIQINGVEQATDALEIGAFSNGECRGSQMLAYYPQADRYLVFLTLYGEAGDLLTFRLYDHAFGEESVLGCTSYVTYEADGRLGTLAEPYPFNFTGIQITEMPQGWRWWSSYIEQTGNNGLEQMEESLGENGVIIKSRHDGFVSNYENEWYGTLTAINNENTYLIQTSAPCVMTVAGEMAEAQAHPVTLPTGWSWMGYPCNRPMSVGTAMGNLNAEDNDLLKSQEGFCVYHPDYGWVGTLHTLMPGMGLMYESHTNANLTFTYPASTPRAEVLEKNITARENYWKPDFTAYPDNMSVIAVVELDGAELNGERYELAAFANGECRGSVKLMQMAGRSMAFLTVSGDEAASLYFGLYDSETGMEIVGSDENMIFATNAVSGSLDEPRVIRFRGVTGMDEWASNLHVYPNPAAKGETFSIDLPIEDRGKVRVEIINAFGQVVETYQGTSVQTIAVPSVAGVYTLRINVEGKGICNRKLVVR